MEKITHNGVKGVFFPDEELLTLQEKILAQNELINQLKNEVGLQ